MATKNPNENKTRRGSKKNKISWRKRSDVKDVDSYLEEKQLEERLGVPFAERPDDELFQIDTQPDTTTEVPEVFTTRSSKRKATLDKSLKCYQVLKSHSAVQDPIAKRNRVRTKEELHPLVTKLKADRLRKGILTKKEQLKVKNQELARAKKANQPKKNEVKEDLWAAESKPSVNMFGKDGEWLEKSTFLHTIKNTRRLQKPVPGSIYKKLSVVSAVETPHPGMSYNPSYEDHQALLSEVAETESKIMKEEKHIHRVTSKMFSRITGNANHNNWMTEMSEGLPNKEIKEEVDSGDDGDYMAINPPAKNAKKPLKKRRKMKEARAELLEKKRAKEERKKLSDVHRLTVLQKEMGGVEAKIEMLRGKREKVKKLKSLETRQLSSHKFKPAPLEFNMAEDIKGNLRNIKTEGYLLTERYNSLQKRNIVAPARGQQMPRKSKVKKFEKSTHKMGWEPKGF